MKARLFIAAIAMSVALFAQDDKIAKPQSQTAPDNTTTQDTKATTKPPAAASPAEMKTQTYRGVLVDTSCGAPASASSSTPAATTSNTTATSQTSADRTTGQGCTLSANSTQLGLKLKDGRTVRFDMVGNQRAQDALKNKKRWSEAASSGKEIHATVKGALTGDKLIVSSID